MGAWNDVGAFLQLSRAEPGERVLEVGFARSLRRDEIGELDVEQLDDQ